MCSDLSTYAHRAREMGAAGARLIGTGSVVTAEWVRWKCRYGCGCYGTNLCCPPHSPSPSETRALLEGYRQALLVHGTVQQELKDLMVALERQAFLDGLYRAFAMGAGPCGRCKECTQDRCVHADVARPAMEACGIDVFATARAAGFPIDVLRMHGEDCNHYGLLLLE
jgi:predicted metal-binding protein